MRSCIYFIFLHTNKINQEKKKLTLTWKKFCFILICSKKLSRLIVQSNKPYLKLELLVVQWIWRLSKYESSIWRFSLKVESPNRHPVFDLIQRIFSLKRFDLCAHYHAQPCTACTPTHLIPINLGYDLKVTGNGFIT